MYWINHHGDGRVALVMMAPRGVQKALVKLMPAVYFVPPYVGPSGWLGVELDKGLAWSAVCEHVREAYEMAAPAALAREARETNLRVRPPTRKLRPEEIDPFRGKAARAVLKRLDTICARLPEAARGAMFGCPIWKAGAKTFAIAHHYTGRLKLSVWVGGPRQRELAKDKRFAFSKYMGHNGWIDFDMAEKPDWDEVQRVMRESYQHYALKRMLKALEEPGRGAKSGQGGSS
jgi:predicted DNA-binding protein (MmcQ/YjbR family)